MFLCMWQILLANNAEKIYNICMEYIVKSLQETQELAKKLAKILNGDEIILISGDLGAGKTTFTKALAEGLEVTDLVTSPTFAFMREYSGRCKLSHYDMYRVEDEDELFELGLSDNLYEAGVCVIEWNKFTEFPDEKCIIRIEITKLGESERNFDISTSTECDCLEKLSI